MDLDNSTTPIDPTTISQIDCEICGNTFLEDQIEEMMINGKIQKWCYPCVNQYSEECESCRTYEHIDNIIDIKDGKTGDEYKWCDRCAKQYSRECDSCKELMTDDMTVVYTNYNTNKELWCYDCLDNAHFCENCNDYNSVGLETVQTSYNKETEWCEDCCNKDATKCDRCDSWNAEEAYTYTISNTNDTLCSSCFENGDYFTCESCNETLSMDLFYGRNDNYSCIACATADGIPGIESADTDVLDEKLGLIYDEEVKLGTNKPYMGVELEVETHDELEDAVERTNSVIRHEEKWGILKSDSSIGVGFEIVTVPMTLEQQKEKWESFFNQGMEKTLHNRGGRGGMHIHLNKNSLTQIGLARLLFLLYGQKDNINFMEFLAERSPNQYWKNEPQDIKKYYKNRVEQKKRDRYEALNLQNESTVEFRLFKSVPNNKQSIFKSIEFVDAAQNFCNNEIFTRPLWQNFAEWVKKTNKYPNLYEYIERYIMKNPFTIKQQSSYLKELFKIVVATPVITVYFSLDAAGNTVYSTEDGNNWWFINSEGITTPMCGEIPQNVEIKYKAFSELQSRNSNART